MKLFMETYAKLKGGWYGMISAEICFLQFILYSFCGWIWESVFCSLWNKRRFINRGFLKGPYCPIYGWGALCGILFLQNIKTPITLFLSAGFACCLLEYMTSWVMEKMFHARWWDYSDKPFNLHGRVYLNGFLAFGGAIVVLIKWINPYVTSILLELPILWTHSLSGFFLAVYLTDNIITFRHAVNLETHLRSVSERYEQMKKQMAFFRNPDARMELFFRQSLSFFSRQQKRILRAFPGMKSLRYPQIVKRLQDSLYRRSTKENDETPGFSAVTIKNFHESGGTVNDR